MTKTYNSRKHLEYCLKEAAKALLKDKEVRLLDVVNGNVITSSNFVRYGADSQDYTPKMSDAVIVSYVNFFSERKEIILFRDVQELIEQAYPSAEELNYRMNI